MVKVFIVDDQKVVLRGLRKTIPWEDYGCTIVGESTNGREALEKCSLLKPDIVITDICMPVMDGLSFINELKRITRHVKIVILTAYNEFEYAKAALENGTRKYLLMICTLKNGQPLK